MVRTIGLFLVFACAAAWAQCSYTVTPTSFTIGAQDNNQFTGTVYVYSASGCAWTAVSNSTWIKVVVGQSGTGNGQVGWSVGNNTTGDQRVGTITVAGKTVTITQSAAACVYTLVPAAPLDTISASGAAGNFTVKSNCSWTAAANQSWIHVTTSSSTNTVSYTVDANQCVGGRSGVITVGDQSFPITQPGSADALTLSPASATVKASGGDLTFTVNTGAGCAWSALVTSGSSWVTVTSGSTGTGKGTVGLRVAANTGGQRTASVSVSPQAFRITQEASDCSYLLSSTSVSVAAAGGTGTLTVTAAGHCAWTAATGGEAWIKINTGSAGTGTAAVSFTVQPNTTTSSRTARLTIAGQTVTLTQAGLAEEPVSLASILNAASYSTTSTAISPGEIVTLFGTGMGPANLVTYALAADGQTFTKTLAQTRVLFNGIESPMIYTMDKQVSAVVPYAVAGESKVTVQVEYKGVLSNALTVNVDPTAPGIFTQSATGTGPGAILNEDYTLNTASNPAAGGSVIMIFATGEGITTPAGTDGKLADPTSLGRTYWPVSVQIGGQDCAVKYAGNAPTLITGLAQINVEVPKGLAPGTYPILLLIGPKSSPSGVTVAVK